MARLAIVTTHPIQYHAAWFRELARRESVDLEVLYCHNATAKEQADAGFGVEFNWDVSLIDGYQHRFLKNISPNPTIATFGGLDTPDLLDLMKKEKFDAVMINGWHYKSAWQAMRACWKTNTPVMMRSDSHLHSERPFMKRLSKWPFYRWFISKIDVCLPVGTWSRDYFLHYGARPEITRTVPHAVDTSYFSDEVLRLAPLRTELRRKWGLQPQDQIFLFVGKFIEKKRPLDFIEAISKSNQRASSIAGLMVGDGPLREQCEIEVQQRQAPIRFSGFLNQSEIAAAYVAADALVLPSDGGETWGLVVNEAMACGRPCFVSDHVGAGPDMVVPNETGDVFKLGDTSELANKMVSAVQDDYLTRSSVSATQMASKYSVNAATDALLEAIEMTTRTA